MGRYEAQKGRRVYQVMFLGMGTYEGKTCGPTSAALGIPTTKGGVSPRLPILGLGKLPHAIEACPEYLNDQVFALYSRYLNRTPDSVGSQYWTNFLLAGGTLEQVAEGLVSSAEYYIGFGGTNPDFISAIYGNVLHRRASNLEIGVWLAALDSGVSRLNASVAFLNSQESRTDLIQVDYMTYLQRSADSGGLAAWVNAINAGAPDQQVLAGIFGSVEGYQLWS